MRSGNGTCCWKPKGYPSTSARFALNNINFHVGEGEVLGVVGDNGAGKSTLMKITVRSVRAERRRDDLSGQKRSLYEPPRKPAVGHRKWSTRTLRWPETCRSMKTSTWGANPARRVGPLRIVDHSKARQMAADHLDKLKIHVKSIDQNTENLSGGQRQAVAIAGLLPSTRSSSSWTSRQPRLRSRGSRQSFGPHTIL